jgi:hypothetical protein
MPCDAPWPEEHVERFRNWIDVGMPGRGTSDEDGGEHGGTKQPM